MIDASCSVSLLYKTLEETIGNYRGNL